MPNDNRPHEEINESVAALAAAQHYPVLDLGEVVIGKPGGYTWREFLHSASPAALVRAEAALQARG